jgi:hypothetical protein
MKENNKRHKRKQPQKSYEMDYSPELEAMILKIFDADGMYPCYLRDPDAGLYKIIKTRSGGLQMCK